MPQLFNLTLTNLTEKQVLSALTKLIGQVSTDLRLPTEIQLSNDTVCKITEIPFLEQLLSPTGKRHLPELEFSKHKSFPPCVTLSEKETIQRNLPDFLELKHPNAKNGWVLLGRQTWKFHPDLFMSITVLMEVDDPIDTDYYAIPINPEHKTWFMLTNIVGSQNKFTGLML